MQKIKAYETNMDYQGSKIPLYSDILEESLRNDNKLVEEWDISDKEKALKWLEEYSKYNTTFMDIICGIKYNQPSKGLWWYRGFNLHYLEIVEEDEDGEFIELIDTIITNTDNSDEYNQIRFIELFNNASKINSTITNPNDNSTLDLILLGTDEMFELNDFYQIGFDSYDGMLYKLYYKSDNNIPIDEIDYEHPYKIVEISIDDI